MTGGETVIAGLHPVMAGIVFAHLANGDDVSIVDGSVRVAFGPNRHNIDGPAVDLARVDPDAILGAHFNGVPVDEVVLAALVGKALQLSGKAFGAPGGRDGPSADTAT